MRMATITNGVFPPITTPFDDNGRVDYDDLDHNIRRLENAGVDGIVSCGSTGERSTLTPEEHRDVIEFTTNVASTPVIAGTGSPSTWETKELNEHASTVGADGALVLAPYYTSPSDDDLVNHYSEIADDSDIPIILYNYPSAIGFNLSPDVVVELATHDTIVGIKDSLGDFKQINELTRRTKDIDFDIMSGWDSLIFPAINVGATGLVGITANVFPESIVELVEAAERNENEKAREIHHRVSTFEEALLIKNPQITVSESLGYLGHTKGNVRKPQYPLTDDQAEQLHRAIDEFSSRSE